MYTEGKGSVVLAGHLERRWAFGRPNYGENPESDEVEFYYVLVLKKPIEIIGFDGDKDVGVTRLQIGEGKNSALWSKLNELADSPTVIVTGRLSRRYTMHVHEQALVSDLIGLAAKH